MRPVTPAQRIWRRLSPGERRSINREVAAKRRKDLALARQMDRTVASLKRLAVKICRDYERFLSRSGVARLPRARAQAR